MSLKHIVAAAALAISSAAALQAADTTHGKMDHSKMGQQTMAGMTKPGGDKGPSSLAFAKANARMHAAMDIAYSGNADADFVRGMIAHHQGAIDMAKIELQYGDDAGLRALAERIIAAQETEIKTMKDWLAKNGG